MKPSERCAKAMEKWIPYPPGSREDRAHLIAEQTGCDEMLEALEGFVGSGVEWDGPTNNVTMQVDRGRLKDAKALVAKFRGAT